MRRRLVTTLVAVVVVAVGSLAATLAAGWSPALGLDLQGGFSVVLAPEEGADVDSDVLDQSIAIIRDRVDALGVAEPEITRQGDTILVELPGIADQERARSVVGQTAELRFRPVLELVPPEGATTTSTTTSTSTTVAEEGAESTTTSSTTTTTTAPAGEVPTTPRSEDDPEVEVVLPGDPDDEGSIPGIRYRLGPAALRGEAVSEARAEFFSTEWVVALDFTGQGNDAFNAIAERCFNRTPECPTQQLAIVLDGVVQSAPTIQEPRFSGTAQITGGFGEREAKNLALVLRYGALPVQLETLTEQRVSATLGRDALDAGVTAGIIGFVLVGLYLTLYYRLLGIVAVASLTVGGAVLWALIAWLGETQGLALTLAGVTGIIVSIGVAVDSNVVYYERLKEEVQGGATLRSAVDKGFDKAFSTILRADSVSLIGAALLYFFTVGPVRGFAFFLGLSTLIDIFIAWWFMRPATILLARSPRFGRPSWFGMPAPAASTAAAPGIGGDR
jgi:preprotein translocase subunit SecD